ncbi:MAG: lysozyme inhibitor LprI family protein [Novosphingobium sp.]
MTFALVLLLTASPQAALQINQEPTVFRDPPACWNGSQHEMTVCAGKELQQSEAEMNAQLARVETLMSRLDADAGPPNEIIGNYSRTEALRRGQAAWLTFRLEHCRIQGAGGGSMARMLIHLCERDATRLRTLQLNTLMLNPATGNPYYEDQ